MKKRFLAIVLVGVLCATLLMGCDSILRKIGKVVEEGQEAQQEVDVKPSPDKYTWYIKNYVGKNCASIGERSALGDYRVDKYGAGYLYLLFVSENGEYIDNSSDEILKEYKVTGQNIKPNSVMKYTFELDENGNEYDYLVDCKSYENIILSVCKVGEKTKGASLTEPKPWPDRYTCYTMDYVGRNLANCGELSYTGEYLVEKYGEGYIKLVIVTEDGSFVDPADTEQLKKYIVTGQNIKPNTEIKYTFQKDENGNEYTHLVDTQNVEEIELTASKI